jgi:hypothetical protein
MLINVEEIVMNKLKEMDASGLITKKIEEAIESSVNYVIKESFDRYSFTNEIRKKMEEEVSQVVKQVSFSGYNSFIAETLNRMINETAKQDLLGKIEEVFNSCLLVKHEGMKLSQLIEMFREQMNEMDYQDKDKIDFEFYANIEDRDKYFFTISLGKEKPSYSRYDADVYMHFSRSTDKNKCKLIGLRFNGKEVEKILAFSYMNELERVLANLFYNKTDIELDIDLEDDIETYIEGRD